MKKNTEKSERTSRKEYHSMKNSWVISWRLNAEKMTLLQKMMRDDGWKNRSNFLDYKVFGDIEYEIDKLINEKDPESIALLLRNQMLELSDYYLYFKYRYDKDMSQLYQEEGVNLKEWIAKTNKWHSELVKVTQKSFKVVAKIADALGIKEYFDMPSDSMDNDAWNQDKETRDKMAAQLRKEHIALGLGDIIDN